MDENRFEAQGLVETATRETSQTFEVVFVDKDGRRLRLCLPVQIAADALVPILSTLVRATPQHPNAPSFSRNVMKWRVGHSNEEAKVIFQINDDEPFAMHAVDAKKFWRELREEVDYLARRAPPTKQ